MSADILGTSCHQCRSMVQYSFTSTETRRLVRTDSPGRPPWLSHSSWTVWQISSRRSLCTRPEKSPSFLCTLPSRLSDIPQMLIALKQFQCRSDGPFGSILLTVKSVSSISKCGTPTSWVIKTTRRIVLLNIQTFSRCTFSVTRRSYGRTFYFLIQPRLLKTQNLHMSDVFELQQLPWTNLTVTSFVLAERRPNCQPPHSLHEATQI